MNMSSLLAIVPQLATFVKCHLVMSQVEARCMKDQEKHLNTANACLSMLPRELRLVALPGLRTPALSGRSVPTSGVGIVRDVMVNRLFFRVRQTR